MAPPYQPIFSQSQPTVDPELQISTQTDTTTVKMAGGAPNEVNGRVTLRHSAIVVVGSVVILWIAARGLKLG